MEDSVECEGPYEQRLLSLFESCLSGSSEELDDDGLKMLCDKLSLSEKSDEFKLRLSAQQANNHKDHAGVSFKQFRRVLLAILDNSVNEDVANKTNNYKDGGGDGQVPSRIPQRLFNALDYTRASEDNAIQSEKQEFPILGVDQNGYIHSEDLVRMWEVAGVTDAGLLISELGFSGREIELNGLVSVLRNEIRNFVDFPNNHLVTTTHINLLKAAFSLYHEEVRVLNSSMERLKCERDKLRITCSEANDRVSFLAQEIDEQHAKQEKKRIDEIKQLDGKNAETVRQLTDQLNREREAHAAALKAAEEKYLAVQREEQRCRKELADLLKEFHGLETENQSLLEQIDGVKHANNELLKKIRILDAEQEELHSIEDRDNEEVFALTDSIKQLRARIALLQDQNDELTVELESLRQRDVDKKIISEITCIKSIESVNTISTEELQMSSIKEFEMSTKNLAMELESEERSSSSSRDLVMKADGKSSSKSLRDYPPRRDDSLSEKSEKSDEVASLLRKIEQLERSNELLKADYEQCEDYWEMKLEEERQLFEQEQKVNGEKLEELIAKIAEYDELYGNEDQNDGRLSPIEEKCNLEQQYNDLEDEFKTWQGKAEASMASKDKEIAELRAKLQDLSKQVDLVSPRSEKSKNHAKDEIDGERIHVLKKKKKTVDRECDLLMQQRESLMSEIMQLQSIQCHCSLQNNELNALYNIESRVKALDEKRKKLQYTLKEQQSYTESILRQTWKQHQKEITQLKDVIRCLQDLISRHACESHSKTERLAKADVMIKELYVENSVLELSVKRLKQHCQLLMQYDSESTSV